MERQLSIEPDRDISTKAGNTKSKRQRDFICSRFRTNKRKHTNGIFKKTREIGAAKMLLPNRRMIIRSLNLLYLLECGNNKNETLEVDEIFNKEELKIKVELTPKHQPR